MLDSQPFSQMHEIGYVVLVVRGALSVVGVGYIMVYIGLAAAPNEYKAQFQAGLG